MPDVSSSEQIARQLNAEIPPLKHRYAVAVYGPRDHYQVQLALHEAGALEQVFTDFYAPHWLIAAADRVAPSVAQMLRRRHHPELGAEYFSGDLIKKELLLRYLSWRGLTVAQRYDVIDYEFSKRAARYVEHHPKIGLVCYSYYWQAVAELRAAGRWDGPAVVFQVHPAPSQIKRIIREDRARTGLTYLPEPEELLEPERDRDCMASLSCADGIIAASSFTKRGLVESGVLADNIQVVPYGLGTLHPAMDSSDGALRWKQQRPLRLLWVGQLAYRKGAHHLFEAVRHFSPEQVQVTMVTRSSVPDELALRLPPNVTICNSVTDLERQVMYRTHHLFVLPSLVEGFGLVYGEALSEGLPILATMNTGAPDIIRNGFDGFIVSPGNSEGIAAIIEQCLCDASCLPSMAQAIAHSAGQWTWEGFRRGIRRSIAAFEEAYDL